MFLLENLCISSLFIDDNSIFANLQNKSQFQQ